MENLEEEKKEKRFQKDESFVRLTKKEKKKLKYEKTKLNAKERDKERRKRKNAIVQEKRKKELEGKTPEEVDAYFATERKKKELMEERMKKGMDEGLSVIIDLDYSSLMSDMVKI